ncbi:MAG: hypothetical protein AB7F40_02030 [Victivallaceae bacterium]|nr:hypothetical protein [Victivallaceae bacterium]
MRLISLLVVVIIIAAAVWFLFFRNDDGTIDITPKPGAAAPEVQPSAAVPANQPTTTYGRALNYSRTTVENANDSHNADIEAAMK